MANMTNITANIKVIIDNRIMEYIDKLTDIGLDKDKLIEVWNNLDKEEKPKKSRKNKTKKINLYQKFCSEQRPLLKEEGIKDFGEMSRKLGELWSQHKKDYEASHKLTESSSPAENEHTTTTVTFIEPEKIKNEIEDDAKDNDVEKQKCAMLNKRGTPCKSSRINGSEYCAKHLN